VFALVLCAAAGCAGARLEPNDPQVLADRARAGVERVRSLRFLKPVGAREQTREERRAEVAKRLAQSEATKPDAVRPEYVAYQLFGLLPIEFDTRAAATALDADNLAGYYSDESLTVIRGNFDSDSENTVIGHELVHALQDQHFSLRALRGAPRDNDAGMALRALIEGDATVAGYDFGLFQELEATSTTDSDARAAALLLLSVSRSLEVAQSDAPRLFVENQMFNYEGGFGFASAIHADLGWPGVDALYSDPPESTEQILYPERYLDWRERPAAIELAPPPDGWTRGYENDLGLFETQLLLSERGVWFAETIASDWDGDRYVVWESEQGPALVWYTVWSTPEAAQRFAGPYARALRKRDPDAETWAIATEGRVVSVVPSAPPGSANELLAQLRRSRFTIPEGSSEAPASTPPGLAGFPVRVTRFARVRQIDLLGGLLATYRGSEDGSRLRLVGGLALRSEQAPGRFRVALAIGQLGLRRDAQRGDTELLLLPALKATWRGGAFDVYLLKDSLLTGWSALRVARSAELDAFELGPLLRWRRDPARARLTLPFGLLEYTRTAEGSALRALHVPFTSRWLVCAGCDEADPQ
jgi:hypothetical protein